MHQALTEILKIMKTGDSTHVRQIILMNLKTKDREEFMDNLHRLKLKKSIIIQNLDILDINKIIDIHGFHRFKIKFWEKVYEYFIAVGDSKMLYELTLRLAPHYRDELVYMLSTKQFFTPAGNYNIQLNKFDANLEIMSHVIRALNDSVSVFRTSTLLKFVGTMFNPSVLWSSGIDKQSIEDAIVRQQQELFKAFVGERFNGEHE